MDVDCCEGGRGKSGSGEEKNDDMAECGEGGDGECVLGRGDGEWGCEDGAGGEDDSDRGKRGRCHWAVVWEEEGFTSLSIRKRISSL